MSATQSPKPIAIPIHAALDPAARRNVIAPGRRRESLRSTSARATTVAVKATNGNPACRFVVKGARDSSRTELRADEWNVSPLDVTDDPDAHRERQSASEAAVHNAENENRRDKRNPREHGETGNPDPLSATPRRR